MTPEILSELNPRTQQYELSFYDHQWQDIMAALQGCDPGHQGFMLYVYGNDEKGRHSFFASLYREIMARPDTQEWIKWRRSRRQLASTKYEQDVERMVLLAMVEWRHPEIRFTNKIRAKFLKISERTWDRWFSRIYKTIVAAPTYWRDEIMRLLNQRLN